MSNIGILGGTFDPIHLAHLIIAEEVRHRLEMEKVLFIPAGRPHLKGGSGLTAAGHRLEMVKLAVAANPCFEVSSIEIDRPGLSYTVDTVRELQTRYGSDTGLFFITGYDAIADLPRWKEPEKLVKLCRVVAVGRPGYASHAVASVEIALGEAVGTIMVVDVPQIAISSTDIRERVARGMSIRYLVPEAVEQYIREHRLYVEGGFEK